MSDNDGWTAKELEAFRKVDGASIGRERHSGLRSQAQRAAPTPSSDDAWAAWCDLRIDAKLFKQRKFIFDVVGQSLGQLLAKERKTAKQELEHSVRALKLELAEALSVINELRSLLAAQRGVSELSSALRARVN